MRRRRVIPRQDWTSPWPMRAKQWPACANRSAGHCLGQRSGERKTESFLARSDLFPFLADLAEAVGAEFELFAEAAQDGGLVAVRVVFEGAGDEVRAFALIAVIDEVVLAQHRAKPLQG